MPENGPRVGVGVGVWGGVGLSCACARGATLVSRSIASRAWAEPVHGMVSTATGIRRPSGRVSSPLWEAVVRCAVRRKTGRVRPLDAYRHTSPREEAPSRCGPTASWSSAMRHGASSLSAASAEPSAPVSSLDAMSCLNSSMQLRSARLGTRTRDGRFWPVIGDV